MCRPYWRGQKLTPPENRILYDHFYNNKLHENKIKHDKNRSTQMMDSGSDEPIGSPEGGVFLTQLMQIFEGGVSCNDFNTGFRHQKPSSKLTISIFRGKICMSHVRNTPAFAVHQTRTFSYPTFNENNDNICIFNTGFFIKYAPFSLKIHIKPLRKTMKTSFDHNFLLSTRTRLRFCTSHDPDFLSLEIHKEAVESAKNTSFQRRRKIRATRPRNATVPESLPDTPRIKEQTTKR